MSNTETEPVCLICHGGDEDGELLLHGVCSCRGGSGYFHQSCMIEYAEAKTKRAFDDDHLTHLEFEETW